MLILSLLYEDTKGAMMARQAHVNITMPADLWKELQDHVKKKKQENPVASASDIIRTLVHDYLKKTKKKSER